MGDEKRKHQRYDPTGARHFIAKYGEKDKVLGEIKDFSRSGLSFDSREHLKKDSEVKIELHIFGLGQSIPVDIKIIWSKGILGRHSYGAQILNMSPQEKFEIMDLLYQDWKKNYKKELVFN